MSINQLSNNPALFSTSLPYMSPRSNRKISTWSEVNFKKPLDLDELVTWARNMVTWYWSADNLFWQVSVDHNMDVQCQRCLWGSGWRPEGLPELHYNTTGLAVFHFTHVFRKRWIDAAEAWYARWNFIWILKSDKTWKLLEVSVAQSVSAFGC